MRRMYSLKQLQEVANRQVQEQISSGNLENVKVFENIVDKDGHKRFIEGDITIDTITGITQKYGKWSLSGSHLLIVLAIDIENATPLGEKVATVSLPDWIMDKIVPLYASRVAYKNELAFGDDSTSQSIVFIIDKGSGVLNIYPYGTITADRHARLQLDLLIDNE